MKMNLGRSRPAIERMTVIRAHLAKGFTLFDMAIHLETSTRTIRRDVDFLRDRLGYTIEYCPTRHRWFGRPSPTPIL